MDKMSVAVKIEQTLQQQIEVMKEVYACQKELSDAVRNRSWEGIERCVLKSTEASHEFLRLDKQCFLFLNQLDPYNEEVNDFYGYIASLPEETKKKLSTLYPGRLCLSRADTGTRYGGCSGDCNSFCILHPHRCADTVKLQQLGAGYCFLEIFHIKEEG